MIENILMRSNISKVLKGEKNIQSDKQLNMVLGCKGANREDDVRKEGRQPSIRMGGVSCGGGLHGWMVQNEDTRSETLEDNAASSTLG